MSSDGLSRWDNPSFREAVAREEEAVQSSIMIREAQSKQKSCGLHKDAAVLYKAETCPLCEAEGARDTISSRIQEVNDALLVAEDRVERLEIINRNPLEEVERLEARVEELEAENDTLKDQAMYRSLFMESHKMLEIVVRNLKSGPIKYNLEDFVKCHEFYLEGTGK